MDYAKRQLKALGRISKKIMDAENHLTKIEDGLMKRSIGQRSMKRSRTSNRF